MPPMTVGLAVIKPVMPPPAVVAPVTPASVDVGTAPGVAGAGVGVTGVDAAAGCTLTSVEDDIVFPLIVEENTTVPDAAPSGICTIILTVCD